ncbi:MAG: nucleotide sugar epimerase [Sphingomonadales bacterium]|nr:nucleotide sugar epimerase [Sphingomonadales bacterium]
MTAITVSIGDTKDQTPKQLAALRKTGRRTVRRLRSLVRLTGVATLDGVALFASMGAAAACANKPSAVAVVLDPQFLLLFGATTMGMFALARLYRRCWRFLSFSDCTALAITVAAGLAIAWVVSALIAPAVWMNRFGLMPLAIVHWSLLMLLMLAMRMARRGLRERRIGHSEIRLAGTGTQRRRALLLGDLNWARTMIELIRVDVSADIEIVGILTPDGDDTSLWLSGVPILGSPDQLTEIVELLDQRGRRPVCVVMRDSRDALERGNFVSLAAEADLLNLKIARAPDPWTQMSQANPRLNLEFLPMAELLGRPEIKMDPGVIRRLVENRRVLVTGAGGTIGGELVRQLAAFQPTDIVLLDHAEYNLYAIEMEVREKFPDVCFHVALSSIRQKAAVRGVFAEYLPEIVFHAAALKHVPLVEANPCPGVHTNVIGTRNVADAACEFGVRTMVQVSTDKAVNPVGLMGATKRVGELYCQALDIAGEGDPTSTRFMTVRFGNVLGSSGSLIPLFKQQLAQGKPLTVTHPDIERYFMTVEEAVQLILQSSARAVEQGCGRGTIFVLDMGAPVKIVDIARRMIRMAGLVPERDVPIRFVGLRPGEKLFEELFDTSETRIQSCVPGVFEARPVAMPLTAMENAIAELERLVLAGDGDAVRRTTHELVKGAGEKKAVALVDGLDTVLLRPSVPTEDMAIVAAIDPFYAKPPPMAAHWA